RAPLGRERHEQVLDAHVLVLETRRLALRRLERRAQPLGERERSALDARHAGERLLEFGDELLARHAQLLQHRRDRALGLGEERREEVLGSELGVAELARQALGAVERLLGFHRVAVEVHGSRARLAHRSNGAATANAASPPAPSPPPGSARRGGCWWAAARSPSRAREWP